MARAQNLDLSTLTGKVGGGNQLLNGLTAYWKMDEAGGTTRNDSTANVLNLTDKNANLANEAGKIGNSVVCSQTSSTNSLFHSSNALFNTGVAISISFSCWIRANGLINNSGIIDIDAADGVNAAYAFWYAQADASVHWSGFESGTLSVKEISIVTAATLGTVTYHHFAFGYDATNKIMWSQLDNGARSTVAIAGGMNAITNQNFTIGNWSNGTAPNQVAVDELGYWRRVLTPTDVANLYNNGNALAYSKFTS